MMENFAEEGIEMLAGLFDDDLIIAPTWDPGESKADFVAEMRDYCKKVSSAFDEFESRGIKIDYITRVYVDGNAATDVTYGYPDYPQMNFEKIQNNLRGVAEEYARAAAAYRNA